MLPLEGDNKLNRLFILLEIVICSVKHLIDISQGLRRVPVRKTYHDSIQLVPENDWGWLWKLDYRGIC